MNDDKKDPTGQMQKVTEKMTVDFSVVNPVFNVPKLFRLAFNAITSFSTVPLRLAVHIGIISSFLSLIVGLYFLYRKILYGIPVLGYASVIVSVFSVGGIQLLVLGIFGEYLGRVYQEVQKRPLYILKEVL
jgi:hypothetical protein